MSDSPHVLEATAETFEAAVIEQSRRTPIVLDFWAAWCQPCRRLGPLLENLAQEYAGQFVLVKADVDQLPQQAAAFRVEGIPAVYALRDAQVVDSFVGLLTESQLREWLRGILPSEAARLTKEAAALEASDAAAAEAKYRQAAELEPQLADAQLGLVRVFIARGAIDEARQIIERLEARGFLEPEAQRVKALLALQSSAATDEQLARLHAAAQATPLDGEARLALGEAFLAAGRYEEGLTQCLQVVTEHLGEIRDAARLRMLDAFRVLGDEAELTRQFRRELSMALYS
jgi:putative thioredoxin